MHSVLNGDFAHAAGAKQHEDTHGFIEINEKEGKSYLYGSHKMHHVVLVTERSECECA